MHIESTQVVVQNPEDVLSESGDDGDDLRREEELCKARKNNAPNDNEQESDADNYLDVPISFYPAATTSSSAIPSYSSSYKETNNFQPLFPHSHRFQGKIKMVTQTI